MSKIHCLVFNETIFKLFLNFFYFDASHLQIFIYTFKVSQNQINNQKNPQFLKYIFFHFRYLFKIFLQGFLAMSTSPSETLNRISLYID